MSNQDRLLSDEELEAELYPLAITFDDGAIEKPRVRARVMEDIREVVDIINTQKRLYAESEAAEPKAIVAGLAEELEQMEKLGRKYVRISHITYSIGVKLAEQRARIK